MEDEKLSLVKILTVSRQIDQLAQSISQITRSQQSTALSARRLMLEVKAPLRHSG